MLDHTNKITRSSTGRRAVPAGRASGVDDDLYQAQHGSPVRMSWRHFAASAGSGAEHDKYGTSTRIQAPESGEALAGPD